MRNLVEGFTGGMSDVIIGLGIQESKRKEAGGKGRGGKTLCKNQRQVEPSQTKHAAAASAEQIKDEAIA